MMLSGYCFSQMREKLLFAGRKYMSENNQWEMCVKFFLSYLILKFSFGGVMHKIEIVENHLSFIFRQKHSYFKVITEKKTSAKEYSPEDYKEKCLRHSVLQTFLFSQILLIHSIV